MSNLSRISHLLSFAFFSFSLGLSGQYVQTQNEIWLDTWPGQAAGVSATVADYSVYYWYDLTIYSYMYENNTYRGNCFASSGGYYAVSCVIFSPLNPGSEYMNHAYHDVTTTYYAPGPVNVPYNSQCYYSSCWWDYYGFSLVSTYPYYYPSFATYFAPGTQISIPYTSSKTFETESRKRAPGNTGREYYLSYKAFIPYDNLTSGNPTDLCSYWEYGEQYSPVWYSGDYRQWTYWGTSRSSQFQWVIPSQARNAAGYRNPGSAVGTSNSYALSGMVSNSSSPSGFWIDYNSIPEWDPLGDCRMRHGRTTGVINIPSNYTSRNSSQTITSFFAGSSPNPLAPFSFLGPIRWTLQVQLTEIASTSPVSLQYSVTGSHSCFPAQEVWVDSNQLYSRFPNSLSDAAPCLLGIYPMVQVSTSGTRYYY